MAVQGGLKGLAKQQVKQQASMLGRGLIHDTVESHHLAYNFYVEINGHGFSFKKVSGLELATQFEEVHEGGYNGYAHRMRNYDSGQHVLTLEYGSTNVSFMLDNMEPGRYIPDGVYVTTLNQSSLLSGKMFTLEGCYLQKISFGELDAEQSAVMINRMEIVYSKLSMPSFLG
jgi:phage tail-like protein